MSERLQILSLSPMPPLPARIGAQRRIQGLLTSLGKRHDVDAIALCSPEHDAPAIERGMREHCRHVTLVPMPAPSGAGKRLEQLTALFSWHSYERRHFDLPAFRAGVDAQLRARRYDVALVEFPFFSPYALRVAPPGAPPPRLVLDEHNVEFDLAHQMAGLERGLARHLHNSVNWRKLQREELGEWRRCDAVAFTSIPDEQRARALVPGLRSRVVPNGVDVSFFRPRPEYPPGDGRTVLFFGTFNYYPNLDGVLFFLREVWPQLAAARPEARLKIIGAAPPPEVLAFRGPRVEVAGLVDDVRPHISGAAAVIAPLLIGGGTRLKIVEAMAMARPVVATALGAEGIEAVPGRDLFVADEPGAFAAAISRLLDDRDAAERMGANARAVVETRYAWDVAAAELEHLFHEVVAGGSAR